jgi:hypothetical protein
MISEYRTEIQTYWGLTTSVKKEVLIFKQIKNNQLQVLLEGTICNLEVDEDAFFDTMLNNKECIEKGIMKYVGIFPMNVSFNAFEFIKAVQDAKNVLGQKTIVKGGIVPKAIMTDNSKPYRKSMLATITISVTIAFDFCGQKSDETSIARVGYMGGRNHQEFSMTQIKELRNALVNPHILAPRVYKIFHHYTISADSLQQVVEKTINLYEDARETQDRKTPSA